MLTWLVSLTSVTALSAFALQSEPLVASQVCGSSSSAFVDSCHPIRVRLVAGGDNILIRIWPVGTRRLLGWTNAELCTPPSDLDSPMRAGKYVYADVVVRPLSRPDAHTMQFVCIAGATNVTVRDEPW
jgi:hypothetical protein